MTGMALKGQCNLASIMVLLKVSLKETFSRKKGKMTLIAQKLRVMQNFRILLLDSSVTAFGDLIIPCEREKNSHF